jgi:hypothetical protein
VVEVFMEVIREKTDTLPVLPPFGERELGKVNSLEF